MCKYLYNDACECPQCMEEETIIDFKCVPITLFNQVRGTIVGDLKNMDG